MGTRIFFLSIYKKDTYFSATKQGSVTHIEKIDIYHLRRHVVGGLLKYV